MLKYGCLEVFQRVPWTLRQESTVYCYDFRGTVNGEIVTRQYTPVSDVEEKSYFTLLIKVCIYKKSVKHNLRHEDKMSQLVHAKKKVAGKKVTEKK